MILTFPWPPKELSPNARVHWAVKAKAAKSYKEYCFWVMWNKGDRHPTGKQLKITFLPPSNRRADLDNMLSSFKYGIDGIAQYLRTDDSSFEITLARGGAIKGGAVNVEFAV